MWMSPSGQGMIRFSITPRGLCIYRSDMTFIIYFVLRMGGSNYGSCWKNPNVITISPTSVPKDAWICLWPTSSWPRLTTCGPLKSLFYSFIWICRIYSGHHFTMCWIVLTSDKINWSMYTTSVFLQTARYIYSYRVRLWSDCIFVRKVHHQYGRRHM